MSRVTLSVREKKKSDELSLNIFYRNSSKNTLFRKRDTILRQNK
jgi:hypothetical protein